ncbi:phosphatase PAP2 family protein [Sporosarcina siberiensis]|uniref:Phosphatase PAP2 family protein n=1 Tax=Sporosarcina siberiensis TaxID=1365606 RepID=A0ABW4SL08_9BACL
MRELFLRLLLALILCICFGVLFGYIASAISSESIVDFDRTVIDFVQGMETTWLTTALKGFTWIGSVYFVAPIGLLIVGYLYFKLHYRHQAVLFATVMIGTVVVNFLLKIYFKRERPEIHKIMEANGFSFPSGHTMMAFSLYAIIAYIAWRNVRTTLSRVLLFLFAVTMIIVIGMSRIYLGVHFPSDVIGGLAASALWLTIAISVYAFYQDHQKKKLSSLNSTP